MPVETNEQKFKRCAVAAKVALKYGPINSIKIQRENFVEFSGDPDDTFSRYKRVTTSQIKWYIRNHLEADDPIWNGDFIAGITKSGRVHWSTRQYPTFKWWGSPILTTVLNDCPYYGRVKNDKPQEEERHCYSWQRVPALYLNSSYNTVSYVAGLLSTGKHHVFDGETYALYKHEVMRELELFGIKMERSSVGKPRALVSPFWPALFTKYMPESCHSYWFDIKKPYKGMEYAAILWATYANHKIVKNGLPYLPSRRSVFYHFQHENGTLRELQKLRIMNGLFGLNKRIEECLIKWFEELS
jgi:hypothetical protein